MIVFLVGLRACLPVIVLVARWRAFFCYCFFIFFISLSKYAFVFNIQISIRRFTSKTFSYVFVVSILGVCKFQFGGNPSVANMSFTCTEYK